MPDNNRKVLSEGTLLKLEGIYEFVFDKDKNEITTCIVHSQRKTIHKADEKFSINCKSLKRKVTFSLETLNIWKDLQQDKRYVGHSLFRVNNTINKLKAMYQEVNKRNVLHMIKIDFNGIKRI